MQKLLLPLFLSALILCGIRYLFQPYTVWVDSMAPTLRIGEKTIIESLYRLKGEKLKRFDLVAIIPPYIDGKPYKHNKDIETQIGNLLGLPGLKHDPLFVRRIIALPGETVLIKKDIGIIVNGRLLEETAFTTEKPNESIESLKDIETPEQAGSTKPYGESQETLVVPKDHYLILPDHRNHYMGSDRWGFVNEDRVIGRVAYKFGLVFLTPIKRPEIVFANEKINLNDEGVRALAENKFGKAIHLFNQAMKIDKNYSVAKDNLSIAYNNYAITLKNKPEAAMDKLHKALYIDPDNELTRKNLANLLTSINKDPNDFNVRFNLAEVAFKEKRFLDALVEYREAQSIKPDDACSAKIELLETQKLFPEEHFAKGNAK